MSIVDGTVAPAGGEQRQPGPSGPLRIVSSQRVDATLAEWARPVPPRLWERIAEERRAAHERLVASAQAAAKHAADLTERLRVQRVKDEQTLEAAVKRGRAPAAPGALDLERELEGARERERELIELVH